MKYVRRSSMPEMELRFCCSRGHHPTTANTKGRKGGKCIEAIGSHDKEGRSSTTTKKIEMRGAFLIK